MSGASGYGTAVYGTAGSQHAVGAGSNVIATNSGLGQIVGGSRRHKRKSMGSRKTRRHHRRHFSKKKHHSKKKTGMFSRIKRMFGRGGMKGGCACGGDPVATAAGQAIV